MKRPIAIVLLVLMLLSLAACKKDEQAPTGGIADIEGGGAQASEPSPSDAEGPAEISRVELSGDKVIFTTDDGGGTVSVQEFIYKDGALGEITLTFRCSDAATAKALYDQMMISENDMTQAYKDIKLNDKDIVCKLSDDMLAAYSGMSQNELAYVLSGGKVGSLEQSSDGKTVTINRSWSELALPDGFPQLADGVTSFLELDKNSFMMDWDVMSKSDAEAMAAKLENWAGAEFEVMGDDAATNWSIYTDALSVTLSYYADTFDGAMNQVTLNIAMY